MAVASCAVLALGLLAACKPDSSESGPGEPENPGPTAETVDKSDLAYVSSLDKYKKTDWSGAKWIWADRTTANSYVAFRKTFELDGAPKTAVADIRKVQRIVNDRGRHQGSSHALQLYIPLRLLDQSAVSGVNGSFENLIRSARRALFQFFFQRLNGKFGCEIAGLVAAHPIRNYQEIRERSDGTVCRKYIVLIYLPSSPHISQRVKFHLPFPFPQPRSVSVIVRRPRQYRSLFPFL